MTANGYLQLTLYLVVLLALAKPLGAYMARVYENQPIVLGRSPGPGRADPVSPGGSPPGRRDGLEELRPRHADVQHARTVCRVPAPARPGIAPAESREPRRGRAAPGIQHGRQLRVQHQLAIVWRRDDAELPHADARPDGAELRLGRVRDGVPCRGHPRSGPPYGPDDRQLLGRPGPVHPLHPLAPVPRGRHPARVAGRRADLPALRQGAGPSADDVRRAGDRREGPAGARREGSAQDAPGHLEGTGSGRGARRVADHHQAARHQRGRVLQRQLVAPLREPHAALELPRDAGHPTDPRRALLHLRRHGEGYPARMGHPGGHDADLRATPGPVRGVRAGRQPRLCQGRPRRRGQRIAVRREHGRQGGPLRHRQLRPLGHGHDGGVQRLGELHARLLHPAGRAGAHVADAARRGRVRRRGLRAVRDAGLCHRRRVRGRSHGGPDAGVPREEDRGLRDEDGGPGRADPADARSGRRRPWRC